MIRLPAIIRRLGNEGAVTNVRHDLIAANSLAVSAAELSERVRTVDDARIATMLSVRSAA